MNELLAITTKTLISALVFLSGAFSALLGSQEIVAGSWADHILGPLGALALAVAAIAWLVRYLMRQEKKLEESQEQRLQEAQDQIDYWRDQANK